MRGEPAESSSWASTPTQSYGGAPTYAGGNPLSYGSASGSDPRGSIKAAVILAMIFGPLGIFYVSFLNGVAALFIVVPIARYIGLTIMAAHGLRIDPLAVVVPIMWCMTVPWAIVGTRWRNSKFDRKPTRPR